MLDWLSNTAKRQSIRKRAYGFCCDARWHHAVQTRINNNLSQIRQDNGRKQGALNVSCANHLFCQGAIIFV